MGLINREKEYNYFECFVTVAGYANEASAYLCNVFQNFDVNEVPQHAENMHRIENAADGAKHELTSHLAHDFITPIEREDIAELSQELDDIVDTIEDVIRWIYMLDVKELRPEAIEFAQLIAQCSEIFNKLVAEFSNFKKSKKINDYVIEINTIENKGDKLHEDSLRRLFSKDATSDDHVVWLKIFEYLEASLDASEHAANTIENIIMKNT